MLLTIENLEIVKGGKQLIHNFNASFDNGSIIGLLGPNGVGKSSLLRVIAGLEKPVSGNIQITDEISFLPQDYNLNTDLSVLETILLGRARYLKWYEYPNSRDVNKADEVIRMMDLSDHKEKSFRKLSGGQKQLVLIAQSLVSECRLLLLDEPSSALDLLNQEKLYSILEFIRKDRKISIVFSTHEPNQVLQFADTVLMMSDNHHIYGSTKEIITVDNLCKMYKVDFEKLKSSRKDGTFFLNHVPKNVVLN
jgi:iron complex transport system ATP-binding protein